MKSAPHYLIAKAEDEGRMAAYDFVVARRRWPLLSRPQNPFASLLPGTEALRTAWDAEFDRIVAKHVIASPTRELAMAGWCPDV